MRKFFSIVIFSFLLLFSFNVFSFNQVFAQNVSGSVEDRKKQLEAELAALEQQIKEQEALLNTQRKESGTITRDISILTGEIQKAKLAIKQKTVLINKLNDEIKEKNKTIGVLSDRIGKQKDSLAELLRKANQIEEVTLAEFILSNQTVGEFYNDLEKITSIKEAVVLKVSEIKTTKNLTEKEKQELQEKQDAEVNAKVEIEGQKRSVEKKEGEKKSLLTVSKSKEKTYEQVLKEREKKAAEIRSALFALRDSAAIPFGKALEYATEASKKTGVRPAFVLAILKQESNMGENVGRCNRAGDPPSKKWAAIMKPTRDHAPFLAITAALGFDPDNIPLSCPIGSGWGGAMGPSQFIPSTWTIFVNKMKNILGISGMPNPWDPRHAITASSVYLSDLGADTGTYTALRNAACRYYSGRSCDSKKPANTFYGNSVMAITTDIQENMIDPLQGI